MPLQYHGNLRAYDLFTSQLINNQTADTIFNSSVLAQKSEAAGRAKAWDCQGRKARLSQNGCHELPVIYLYLLLKYFFAFTRNTKSYDNVSSQTGLSLQKPLVIYNISMYLY